MSQKIDLGTLGWEPFFENYFAPLREKGLLPGRIAEVQKKSYIAFTERGEMEVRLSGKYRFDAPDEGACPVVGDWVGIMRGIEEDKGTIQTVLPRKNRFSRKVAGKVTKEQVLAANVDTVLIVTGLDDDFNVSRIERYLAMIVDSGSEPVMILNKSDLCADVEDRMGQVNAIAPSVPVHSLSAELDQGLEALDRYLERGRTVALLGSSGVGKSTIINRLLGEERQRVGPVRGSDGHGRHVTTSRELIPLANGAMIIDNPGMREVQLWAGGDDVDGAFRDIEELAKGCRFGDCIHGSEPGCAVKEALEKGALDHRRYANYLKMKKEVEYLNLKQNEMVRRTERARWNNRKKLAREIKKRKEGRD